MKTVHFPHTRIIAALLVLVCLLGLFPATAFAAEPKPSTIKLTNCAYNGPAMVMPMRMPAVTIAAFFCLLMTFPPCFFRINGAFTNHTIPKSRPKVEREDGFVMEKNRPANEAE